MARRRGKTGAADGGPGTATAEAVATGLDEERPEEHPTFADSRAGEPEAPGAQGDVVLVEESDTKPGAEEPDTGRAGEKKPDEKPVVRGEGKTPEELEAEKNNLRAALRQERRKTRSLLSEVEDERRKRREAEVEADKKKREDASADRRKKLDEAESIHEALPYIKEEIIQEVEGGVVAARRGVIRISQRLARLTYKDYDDVLENSGVAAAITIKDGRAGDVDIWRKLVRDSEDPGEDAYQLGLEILAERGERPRAAGDGEPVTRAEDEIVLDNQPGDRATGRREVLDRIASNAGRPGTLRRFPNSPGGEPRKLTRKGIDAMSDQEYARLPAHIKEQYLAGGTVG